MKNLFDWNIFELHWSKCDTRMRPSVFLAATTTVFQVALIVRRVDLLVLGEAILLTGIVHDLLCFLVMLRSLISILKGVPNRPLLLGE